MCKIQSQLKYKMQRLLPLWRRRVCLLSGRPWPFMVAVPSHVQLQPLRQYMVPWVLEGQHLCLGMPFLSIPLQDLMTPHHRGTTDRHLALRPPCVQLQCEVEGSQAVHAEALLQHRGVGVLLRERAIQLSGCLCTLVSDQFPEAARGGHPLSAHATDGRPQVRLAAVPVQSDLRARDFSTVAGIARSGQDLRQSGLIRLHRPEHNFRLAPQDHHHLCTWVY